MRISSAEEPLKRQLNVKRPAGTFALITLFTVALTSTVPTACAGETTVHVVADVQLTDVAFVNPNRMIVAVSPRANPVPLTVTLVPPALDPVLGLRPVIVGAKLKRSAVETPLVPAGVVTVTSTLPAVSAGEIAVSF